MRCYKVIKKRFVASILCILTLFAIPLQSYAYSDYSETFIGQPIDGTTRWVSPLKSGTNYYYATITSKWNEQRTVGTTPHVGIDLSISQTKTVVAVTSGTLRKDTSTGGSKYNNVTLDTGHPTKKVYCHYEHCSLLQADGYYNQGDKVATGGKYGTEDPHLHFAAYDTNNLDTRKGYRNETLYRSASSWNYGRNCDTFSQMQWNNNTASVTLVFSGSGNTHTEKPSAAQIYYRVHGTTNWLGPYNMVNSSGYTYTYNFRNLVSSGTEIDWVVRYRRSSPAKYMWAPAKFYNPASDPNGSTLKWAYATNTVQY